MSFHDLLQQYFERSSALQSYWTLYVVVIGGLLAFSSLRKIPDAVTTLLVTVLFGLFAYKNLGAIVDVSTQRLAILHALRLPQIAASPELQPLRELFDPVLAPPDIDGIKQFHCVSDLLTVAAVWAMEIRRRMSRSGAAS